ncbi:hypothetical protein KCP73_17160 [Salmonella enterica subsp. enterica]|nr:hypothetical protein KCP73_17160 [Salmonella enterica subsp. enterica]
MPGLLPGNAGKRSRQQNGRCALKFKIGRHGELVQVLPPTGEVTCEVKASRRCWQSPLCTS